ncbi:DNA-directed RNA polymerase subunit delta [Lysinibacillus sp. fkY74-1]|uniref:Probable DNA-directed RNA polymerase subunit delta n=1 Tax=Lysinibacillus pinottii TaxID=2973932 RepID=A0ABT2DQ21_9BACI|nr:MULTISPECIES: DNA-directed RNA polymerase subunit delta [Lysinibacillus]MBE5081996.1 DNA-directed RNA polymerase subunit delta [Bacillus thuringiensis]MBI6863330.1 DNA-directed RNA polymerase subunit delta [Lysinibacillus fusiformis]MCS1396886.1 DNA-directed RNA polymerase subunit delta [Lysinibacillus sp. PB211]MDM5351531.1 DNA-directed RNA polymerase subunit delta [Lysinibacillus sphaericus]MDR0161313.1 DNA-directed RNA polymerase subunit delta [Lysinibacillus sphaericus]
MNFREMTKEQLTEESLINLAYVILNEKRASVTFNDLLKIIQELVGYSDEEIKSRLLQFYTDLNVDGRFLYNQETGWGLREWFKVEQIEEETAPSVKTQKKKSKASADEDDDLEEDIDLDEEDIDFDEDYEEFVDEEEIDEEDEDKEDIDFDEDEDLEDIEEIDEEFIDEEEEEFEEEEEEI